MNTDDPSCKLIHADVTGPLLDAFFQVYRELGYGFLANPYEAGLLLNFGPKAQYKRLVFENSRKGSHTWAANQDAEKR